MLKSGHCVVYDSGGSEIENKKQAVKAAQTHAVSASSGFPGRKKRATAYFEASFYRPMVSLWMSSNGKMVSLSWFAISTKCSG